MLRLCSRKVLDLAKLAAVGSSALQNSANINGSVAVRCLSTVPSTTSPESPVSTTITDPWISIEDWSYAWYDGRDKLHVKMKATGDSTEWRGVGFYSKEGYWMGVVRWNENLRAEGKGTVWLHWAGKDPVEVASSIPEPDSDGNLIFTMWFDTREFVLECNGEPIGGRKNMLYQYKNVGRVWFTDLETYKGEYVIEGPHTDDSGFSTYNDVPLFQKTKFAWTSFRRLQKEATNLQYPDHGWRSG